MYFSRKNTSLRVGGGSICDRDRETETERQRESRWQLPSKMAQIPAREEKVQGPHF